MTLTIVVCIAIFIYELYEDKKWWKSLKKNKNEQ